MKRIICLALCAFLAATACACGSSDDKTPTQATPEEATVQPVEETVAPTEAEENLSVKSFISKFDKTPTVEEKQIYKDKDMTVTVTGINYAAISGPELQLKIDSSFEKDVIVQAPYAIVNDYMISPEMSVKVPAGKKEKDAAPQSVEGTLTLPYFNLAISDITSLKLIEFSMRVVDADSYEPIAKTDLVSVATSAPQDTEVVCDESGQVAYEKDGVKIILKGVNTNRAYSDGAELIVYMYNGTDRNIAIQTDKVIVNGYDMTSTMNSKLLPDKRAVDVVIFYHLDMEEHDIDEIDSVKVSFEIKDADTWENIDSTDLISVKLPEKETTAVTTPDSSKAE